MSKPLDPEHPGKFSSSLVAGLAMLTCFTPEHPVRGIADMAEALVFEILDRSCLWCQ